MTLGEGPIWHAGRKSWCWVDIIEKKLFEMPHSKFGEPVIHVLNEMTSALAVCDDGRLLLATETSLFSYDLDSQQFHIMCKLPIAENMRTNDGGVSPTGEFWISTMEKSPSGHLGEIYSIDSQLEITKQATGIAIPNTMCWLNEDEFLLSDSFDQIMYKVPIEAGKLQYFQKKEFINLTSSKATPDGGAIDERGFVWNAQWGGSKVVCYDTKGIAVDQILLPVPQPSSCCFGGPVGKHLLITTAREGLSKEELLKYPLSGSIFCVELDVKGAKIPKFKLEDKC